MGVGQPQDIVAAVAAGIDMFDCVLPTRCGRNSLVYTFAGQVRLRNARHARDERPLEEGCPCPACRHSRSYLRHLFMAGEMLGPVLASIHNLTFYQRLVTRLREAVIPGRFAAVRGEIEAGLAATPDRDGGQEAAGGSGGLA
jgi:queuine tRNA-ribosyltransferase